MNQGNVQSYDPSQPGYNPELMKQQPGVQSNPPLAQPNLPISADYPSSSSSSYQSTHVPLAPPPPKQTEEGGFKGFMKNVGAAVTQTTSNVFKTTPLPGQMGYETGVNVPQQVPLHTSRPTVGFGTPTVFPTPNLDANIEAETLHSALRGPAVNEPAITSIVGTRTSYELKQIEIAYKTSFGTLFLKDLEGVKLPNAYEKLVNYRFLTPAEFDARNVNKSIKMLGTDDNALIEIFCTRTNQQLRDMREAYRRMFNDDMDKAVLNDTSGDYRHLLSCLMQGSRDETGNVDPNGAVADATLLYNFGEGRWGEHDTALNQIMATRSFTQINAINAEYNRLSRKNLEEVISKELSGNHKLCVLALLTIARDRAGFFAERLYNAMKGLGSDVRTMNRIIISRCELDLGDIKQAFVMKFNKDLIRMVEGEVKGDEYQRLILHLLGAFSKPQIVNV